jgi:hypothetical protein
MNANLKTLEMTSFTLDILGYDGWITSRHNIHIPTGQDVMPVALQVLEEYPNEQSAALSKGGQEFAYFDRGGADGAWQFGRYS